MPITVVSVAKSYSNRGNHVHRAGTKKRWYLYYIDEDGKFRTKRINALEALYYRGKKTHRYRVVCPECGGLSLALVRSLKECIIQNRIQDIGKIKPIKKMVNLNADRKRLWLGTLKSVDDGQHNDSLSLSLSHFSKDEI